MTKAKSTPITNPEPITESPKEEVKMTTTQHANVKTLCEMFHLDGKLVRRHIRAKFVKGGIRKQTEQANAKYDWATDSKEWTELVAYFKALTTPPTKPEVKEEVKA